MGARAQRKATSVGQAHRLCVGVVLHAEDREDRAEGFLLGDQHVLSNVREHRGLEELSSWELLVPATAGQHAGTLRHRIVHKALVSLQARRVRARSAVNKVAAQGWRLAQGPDQRRHVLAEAVVHPVVNEKALRPRAVLAHVLEGPADDELRQLPGIRVIADDEGVFAPKLQDDRGERAGGSLHDTAPNPHAANENHLVRRRHQG
mmetsp:Transcript_86063/g.238448  ORF Transcript_86063/g.238448 Transcript_86063/m.238448 type:complete len:205 (-) Transcript_86063:906-1520(-)